MLRPEDLAVCEGTTADYTPGLGFSEMPAPTDVQRAGAGADLALLTWSPALNITQDTR